LKCSIHQRHSVAFWRWSADRVRGTPPRWPRDIPFRWSAAPIDEDLLGPSVHKYFSLLSQVITGSRVTSRHLRCDRAGMEHESTSTSTSTGSPGPSIGLNLNTFTHHCRFFESDFVEIDFRFLLF